MLGLDKLIEKLLEYWDKILPFEVIEEYDKGVRLRLGKFRRRGLWFFRWRIGKLVGEVLEPGMYWKIPFADELKTIRTVPTTLDLSEQTVTTSNTIQLVVESVIKYEVEDAAKVLLEVESPKDALADMSKGIIRKAAVASTWPETNTEEFERTINRKIKAEAKKWGIKVHEVSIVTMAPMRSVRLVVTNSTKLTELKE